LAVISGWLLTMADTGDSNAILDTGDVVQEITYSHRIQVRRQPCWSGWKVDRVTEV